MDRTGGLAAPRCRHHYSAASRMLGVVENSILGPSDLLLKQVADATGVGHTFYRTNVAIFQAPGGKRRRRNCSGPDSSEAKVPTEPPAEVAAAA